MEIESGALGGGTVRETSNEEAIFLLSPCGFPSSRGELPLEADGDLGVLYRDRIEITGLDRAPCARPQEQTFWNAILAGKGEFRHLGNL